MTTITPPIEDTQQAGCQPRLVRRFFNVDDMPQDEDYNDEAKRAIARVQMEHLRTYMGCFCARCREHTRMLMAYKCRWCGVWYCHACAGSHFGPDVPANDLAHRQPGAET